MNILNKNTMIGIPIINTIMNISIFFVFKIKSFIILLERKIYLKVFTNI